MRRSSFRHEPVVVPAQMPEMALRLPRAQAQSRAHPCAIPSAGIGGRNCGCQQFFRRLFRLRDTLSLVEGVGDAGMGA